jgi:hypothetical protein
MNDVMRNPWRIAVFSAALAMHTAWFMVPVSGQTRRVPDRPVRGGASQFAAPLPKPVLPAPSRLPSLKDARDTDDRCEVLVQWLGSGTPPDPRGRSYPRRSSPELMALFRDEPMLAVFGRPYDRMDTRERVQQHEDVILKCLEGGRSRNVPFLGRRPPDKTMASLAQQLAPFRGLLDQAFLGRPGPFAPANIGHYVDQFRAQSAWASATIDMAASAPATAETFHQLAERRGSVATELSLFSAAERTELSNYIASRQSAIAPRIAERWLTDAARAEPGVASAKHVVSSFAAVEPVLRTLDGAERIAWGAKYDHLVDALVTDSLRTDLARLEAIDASLAGVPQLIGWKTQFDRTYAGLGAIPAVQSANKTFSAASARIYAAALPAWRQQVEATAAEASAIVQKRRDLEALFPAATQIGPTFEQFEAPVRAKEDQLRSAVVAESQKRQQAAQAAAAVANSVAGAGGSGSGAASPLTASSLSVEQLSLAPTLRSLYTGDFAKIDFNRDDTRFQFLYGAYLQEYSDHCGRFLPADKIQLTTRECKTERVTRNGYGFEVSRVCVDWVTVPTGTFVSRPMYEGHVALENLAAADGFREAFRMMNQPNPLATASGFVSMAQTVRSDMDALVRTNACVGAPLKRFEENLRLFALNRPPVGLDGDSASVQSINTIVPGLPFRDQNYMRLMQDLVAVDAKSWVLNRFGRVTGASVVSRDSTGRPARVAARYTYEGFQGMSEGTVEVKFTDGLPECMYFFDARTVCRTPNRRIVAAYDGGEYQR